MRIPRYLLSAVCLLILGHRIFSLAQAQVEVSAELHRSKYLLYERVDYYVTITNNTDLPVTLVNTAEEPWLTFSLTRSNGTFVHAEGEGNFPPASFKPGESRTYKINLTPLFTFRKPGEYRCSAIVEVPDLGSVESSVSGFTVEEGKSIWTQTKPVDGSQRVYSLIRFSPLPDQMSLYLRVEDPDENIVYANYAVGKLVAYIDPDVFFDPAGNLHILHPMALGTYLYTRVDPKGRIEHQGVFETLREVPPRLIRLEDGNVVVDGGLQQSNLPVDRLSDTQPGVKGVSSPAGRGTGDGD